MSNYKMEDERNRELEQNAKREVIKEARLLYISQDADEKIAQQLERIADSLDKIEVDTALMGKALVQIADRI